MASRSTDCLRPEERHALDRPRHGRGNHGPRRRPRGGRLVQPAGGGEDRQTAEVGPDSAVRAPDGRRRSRRDPARVQSHQDRDHRSVARLRLSDRHKLLGQRPRKRRCIQPRVGGPGRSQKDCNLGPARMARLKVGNAGRGMLPYTRTALAQGRGAQNGTSLIDSCAFCAVVLPAQKALCAVLCRLCGGKDSHQIITHGKLRWSDASPVGAVAA
jgi:hypothetical protein